MSVDLGRVARDGDDGAPDDSLDDFDVTRTLAAAGESAAAVHQAEVRALEVDLHYAALHSTDPRQGRGSRPSLQDAARAGTTLAQWEAAGNKLVQLGGDGTPMVQDLPLSELAIARGIHEYAARNRVADALDLAHRLPGYWAALRAGLGEVWVGRKIARMSRALDRDQVRIVDTAVTAAVAQAPGRVLAIAEAAIVRADPDAARAADQERRRRRFLAIGRADESGLRKVFALIDEGDAIWLEAMLDRVADALAQRPDLIDEGMSRDELRAEALGWLAHPEDVIALLNGTYAGEPTPHQQTAVVYAHIGSDEVARVEDFGPMLLDRLTRLLRHSRVELKPVIDLNTGRSVNGYEHPADVKERGFLRTTGDVFPHAQRQSRRSDRDHPTPYDPTGPPGQTGDHNHALLGRRSHRAKTHLGYHVTQIGLDRYLWQTPHGLWRLVDATGTHTVHT